MNTYTPPQGNTPQGQAVATAMPNSTNTTPPPGVTPGMQAGDMSSFPSDQSLNNSFQGANAANITANLGSTRQGYVNDEGLPGMQTNYDDLAKKLFQYDQGTLDPKFAGTNPGTPTDAASFGRVDASPLAMTLQTLGLTGDKALSSGNGNPKFNYNIQNTQADSLNSLIGILLSGMSSRLSGAKSTNAANVNASQAALDAVTKIMGLKQDTVKANAQNQTEINKTLLTLGLATTDSKGNIKVASDSDVSGVVKSGDRKSIQDAYNALPSTSPMRNKMANAWKSAHGNSLFPGALDDKQQESLSNTVDLMNRVQRIVNVYAKYGDKIPQGKIGEYEKFLLQNHIPGTPILGDITGANNIPKDLQQAITDMIALRGQGERQIIGGRLTGYLLNVLGPAFPGIDNMADLTRSQLTNLQKGINNKLNVFAKSSGYDSTDELLKTYNQEVESSNPTSSKSSSQTKVINGATYTKVPGGWQKQK